MGDTIWCYGHISCERKAIWKMGRRCGASLQKKKKGKERGSIAGNFKPSGFQFVAGLDVEHAQTTPSSVFVHAGGAQNILLFCFDEAVIQHGRTREAGGATAHTRSVLGATAIHTSSGCLRCITHSRSAAKQILKDSHERIICSPLADKTSPWRRGHWKFSVFAAEGATYWPKVPPRTVFISPASFGSLLSHTVIITPSQSQLASPT